MDFRKLHKYAYVIFCAAVILLCAVFIPGIGKTKLGAARWIGAGGFSIQPSEIAKFAFVVFAAKIFSKTSAERAVNGGMANYAVPDSSSYLGRIKTPTPNQILSVLCSGGVICLLIILEPNMSITVCMGIVVLLMMFLCGVRLKTLAIIILPAIAAAVWLLAAEPYRLERLSAFADPWANPKGEGFQLIESLYSIAHGGLFGVGFGNSTQKYMFLPFAESDFIFSIIAEELGLVGCVLLFCLFAYIVYKIFKTGICCKDFFGRYLCFGIASVIFVQSALNFAVATGCLPPTGLPLPFVSFGGTSLFVFLTAIGTVLNVDKYNKAANGPK
jgi:cell division protein FtsW